MRRQGGLATAARSLAGVLRLGFAVPSGAVGEGYRPALDGVRAVAVLAILAYHATNYLRGGYLGVDAFFVLSGYLITTLLLQEQARTGRIRLGQFWARRARRLLPALVLTVVAVAVTARLTAPVEELFARSDELLATLLYRANWHFISVDEDYFAIHEGVSPVRHLWSLAIEEQFYLVWPLVATCVLAWARAGRRVLLGLCVAGAAASALAMAALFDPVSPSRAYFGTDARAHQILIGAALAAAMALRPGLLGGRGAQRLSAWVGPVAAGAAGAAVLMLPDGAGAYYRGGSVLFAVAVACALWAVETRPKALLGTLLSISWLTWVGRVSYGLYLWHWPMVVWFGDARLDLSSRQRLVLEVVGTFVLAALSYYVVERPIRAGRVPWVRRSARRLAVAAPAVLALTALAVMMVTSVEGEDGLVAAARADRSDAPCPSSSPGVAGHLWCERTRARTPGSPTVVVAGDSTSRALDPGMRAVAADRGWDYVQAGQGGCSLMPIVVYVPGEAPASTERRRRCKTEVAAMLAAVAQRERPDVWVVADRHATVGVLDDDGNPAPVGSDRHLAVVRAALRETLTLLTAAGAQVVIVATLPVAQPAECISAADSAQCGLPAFTPADPATARLNSLFDDAAHELPRVTVVSVEDVLCPDGRVCPTVVAGQVARYDSLHLTRRFSKLIVPTVVERAESAGVRFVRRPYPPPGG